MRIKQGMIRSLVLASAVLAVVGCEGVGNGNKPDASKAVIVKFGNQVSGTTTYTCFSESLQYLIGFTNGEAGNFTNRAKWTSSNPEVLFVSNIGDAVPGESDQFFQISGVLLPRKAGEATITADAVGIRKTLTIKVVDPQSVAVRAGNYGIADATLVKMVPATLQNLLISANFDGYVTDTTASAVSGGWAFDTPDTDVATFVANSNGVASNIVKSGTKNGTLVARPKLLGCASDNPLLANARIEVSVAPATRLVLKREIDNPPNTDDAGKTTMLVGTTELLQVFAAFDDAGTAEQNLSAQVLPASTLPAVVLPGFAGLPTGLRALSTGEGDPAPDASAPVTVNFCLLKPAVEGETAACSELSVTTGEIVTKIEPLQSFTLSPTDTPLQALGELQLRALGQFTTVQQDITRHVSWSSSDASVVSIGASNGFAESLLPAAGQVKITATSSDAAVVKTQELTLDVVKPAGAP